MTRRLLWVSLPDQRPLREAYWLSRMPGTRLDALAAQPPKGEMTWLPARYRRPIRRFVEAGALAWTPDLRAQDPAAYDWVASLELCSLVTGQASRWRRGSRTLQAVVTWENLARQPLYYTPAYRQAFQSTRQADLMLCMIDAARDHLLENGFEDHRIRVVKPGVDTELFTPAASAQQDPVVVFCSPLAPNKGIDRVLAAMRLVRRRLPEARLVVAGNGPLMPLVQQAAADPTSGVQHAGQLDAQGVAELLRSAAVFSIAPRPTWKWAEQFGLAYLEAQAAGLPVVTTACGSNHEAVAAPNLLVDDDPEALAEGLLAFLTDPQRRAQVGAANRQRMLHEHELATQCARMGEAFADIEAQRT